MYTCLEWLSRRKPGRNKEEGPYRKIQATTERMKRPHPEKARERERDLQKVIINKKKTKKESKRKTTFEN